MNEPPVTILSYEKMVEDALRGVLCKALEITQEQGLPGSHHFYITFDTTHPDVSISDSLRAQHPNEMTIVLQHQFWDLNVGEDGFEVTLSFSGVSQHLCVPFSAVTAFADPHAKFGLQFHVEFEDDDMEDDLEDEDEDLPPVDTAAVTRRLKMDPKRSGGTAEAHKEDPADEEETGDNVVTLDTFRKK